MMRFTQFQKFATIATTSSRLSKASPFTFTIQNVISRNFAMVALKNMEELRNIVSENPSKLVVIEWKATWCGKCKIVAEELNRLSGEYQNAIFCEANIDESDFPQGKEEAQIESIPTVHFIKNDKFLGQSVGVKVNELRQQLETFAKEKGEGKSQ